ncbi:MAG: DUF4342 domain-containing protein [Bacillota bacterium]|nr:DUF4342 domain-containing protein [Bacillota bacterium]
MQINLEQVEFLKDKAGLSYEEAMIILEKSDGDLLQALHMLEQQGKLAFTPTEEKEKVWQKVWKKGKSAKINVKRTGGTLFRVPLVIGIAGVTAFPRLASWSMLGLLLTRCSLEIDLD